MQNKNIMPPVITTSNRNKILHQIPPKIKYNSETIIVVPNNNCPKPIYIPKPISPITPVNPQQNLGFWEKIQYPVIKPICDNKEVLNRLHFFRASSRFPNVSQWNQKLENFHQNSRAQPFSPVLTKLHDYLACYDPERRLVILSYIFTHQSEFLIINNRLEWANNIERLKAGDELYVKAKEFVNLGNTDFCNKPYPQYLQQFVTPQFIGINEFYQAYAFHALLPLHQSLFKAHVSNAIDDFNINA